MSAVACCFDVYGTLCDTSSVTETLRSELSIPRGFAADVDGHWRRKQLQYASQLSQMGAYEPFWEVTRKALEHALAYYDLAPDEATERTILEAYDDLEPFDGAVETLRALRDSGAPVAVLSNGDPGMLERLAENAGLAAHLDAVVSADEVGTFKPTPAVYENAADRLERPIGECRLVSSNAWDVAGAAQAGMGTAWVNRADEPPERVGGEADVVVETLGALPEALADG